MKTVLRFLPILSLTLIASGCRDGIDRSDLLVSGPMLGYSTHRQVLVWAQTARPAAVQVRYWPETKPGFAKTTPAVRTARNGDRIAKVRISNLDPGTRYEYRLKIDGTELAMDYPLRFRTQPLWQWREDPPDFSVAIGSCAFINEEEFDRPGEPYGGDYSIFGEILRQGPDLMVWLGDNVYLREVDWTSRTQMSYRYSHTRRTPEMQPLLANVHHYATWDDHDFGPDNSDGSSSLKGEALKTFTSYWANPAFGLPELPGVFGSFSWGDADFFLLDDRTYRSPSNAPDNDMKTMFGPRQVAWLIDALTASRATFKIVVNGSQMLNPFGVRENLARFTFERDRLLKALQERRINGLILLSGDRHFSELQRLDRPGSYPLFEFTSSPLTSGISPPDGEEERNPQRVTGTLLTERSFGILAFRGPESDRRLALRAFSSDGELRWEQELRASQLRHP